MKILGFLKYYKKETVLAPLLKMSEAVLELFVPLIVASLIDKGINGGAGNGYILKMCLLLVAFGGVGLLFACIAQFFAAKAAVGAGAKIKEALFEHIEGLGYPELDGLGASTVITRLTTDVNQVQSGINLTLRLLLRSPFVVFGSMVMAFFVNARLALIFALAIPVLGAVVFFIMLITIPMFGNARARLDKLVLKTRESITGVRVIRAFSKENEQVREYDTANGELFVQQLASGNTSALLNPITYIMINIAIAFLICRGANSVYEGNITQGSLVALYNYMAQILVELIKLANLIINITRSVACGNRIQAALEITPSQRDGEITDLDFSNAPVEFRNVSLTYGNTREKTLDNISFRLEKGETVGIIGTTGSGKTSLINLIPRFYDCTGGQVLVYGRDVKAVKMSALRSFMGIAPQKAELFKGTVRENFTLADKSVEDAEIDEALKCACAYDFIYEAGGLDAPCEQNGGNFSGGQRQRLNIARAIAGKPKILILDDSTSALDYITDASVRGNIASMKLDGVIIVSQRVSSVREADKIIVLENGACAATGTHGELLRNCPLYNSIYELQKGEE